MVQDHASEHPRAEQQLPSIAGKIGYMPQIPHDRVKKVDGG
jgi:hypothetical protein